LQHPLWGGVSTPSRRVSAASPGALRRSAQSHSPALIARGLTKYSNRRTQGKCKNSFDTIIDKGDYGPKVGDISVRSQSKSHSDKTHTQKHKL